MCISSQIMKNIKNAGFWDATLDVHDDVGHYSYLININV